LARAVVHDISDSLPGALILDTSFAVKILNQNDAEHNRARALYGRLLREGTVCGYLEHIFNLEFWWAWQRAVGELSDSRLERLASEIREAATGQLELRVESPAVRRTAAERRENLLRLGDDLLAMHMSFLSTTKLRVTKRLMESAREIIIKTGLKSMDAVAVAAAFALSEDSGEYPSIATMDKDFRRIAGLHAWGLRTRRP
jgi:predicted nucleic acid-binding protein